MVAACLIECVCVTAAPAAKLKAGQQRIAALQEEMKRLVFCFFE